MLQCLHRNNIRATDLYLLDILDLDDIGAEVTMANLKHCELLRLKIAVYA